MMISNLMERNSEVKIIIQKWDRSKPLPDIDNLLIEFRAFLIDHKMKAETNQERKRKREIIYQTDILPAIGFDISNYSSNCR
jgi:hypothetical protein